MKKTLKESETLCACDLVLRVLDTFRRNVAAFRTFSVKQENWFQRRRLGWPKATVARICLPTITVIFKGKPNKTHSNLVQSYFAELSTPLLYMDDRHICDQLVSVTPSNFCLCTTTSDLLSPVLATSRATKDDHFSINTPDRTVSFTVTNFDTFDIDSDSVFLAVNKIIKDLKSLSANDRKLFPEANLC